jgi:nucleoside-diphosphate-sugar epimerase
MKLSLGGLGIADLDEVLLTVGESWKNISNSKIVVFGGTGFVGTWLVSTLLHANQALDLGLEIVIPTRNVPAAMRKLRLERNGLITFLEEDIRSASPFTFGSADFYVHAATPSVPSTGALDPALVRDATVGGARKILSHIATYPSFPSFLHTSSGAVYGLQSLDLERREEVNLFRGSENLSAYAEAKLESENLVRVATEGGLIRGANPRLFAFLGPHIALDQHFAVGNFVRDGLEGRPIQVFGNPNTVRSYLYPTDLTTWLLKLLANPNTESMNFGSDQSFTMLELANEISNMTSKRGVDLLNPNLEASRYVPSIQNTKRILNVNQKVFLVEGLERWIRWLENSKK